MNKRCLRALISLAAVALLSPVSQATILTFYAGEGNSFMMPQDYGDNVTNTLEGIYSYGEAGEGFTPNVTVEYIGVAGGSLGGDLSYYRDGFHGTTGVLNNEDDGEDFTTFKLTASSGHLVVLHSLLWSGYGSDVVMVDNITVTDQGSNVLYNSGAFAATGISGTMNFGSITGQTLTVTADLSSAGNNNDSFGFDDVTFSEMVYSTEPTKPTITVQPESIYTDEGNLVMFSVVAYASSGSVSYAWMKDATPLSDNEFITGTAYSRLVIAPAEATAAGDYQVVCTDAQGSTTSAVAILSFNLPLPSITSEPSDITVASGANASFSVVATNAMSYQWYVGETAITGKTNATVQLNAVTQTDNGVYSARITNARGSVTSLAARLAVSQPTSLGQALDNDTIVINNAENWFSQTNITGDAEDAVQSADIGNSQSTSLSATLIGPGDYSFDWTVSSESGWDKLRWNMDNGSTEAVISGSPAWTEQTGFAPDNAHVISWTYYKDGGSSVGEDSGFIDQFVFTPYGLSSVENAVDTPPGTLVLGGTANWYGQDNNTHDGTDAARSPQIGHNESAWLETTVQGPGMVTFWNYVSSESNNDYLRLRVDGESVYARSGENTTWVAVTNWISWGTHTLRWAYEKDESVSLGDDAVWVDQISYTPVVRSSLAAAAADGSNLIWTTSGTNPWFGQNHFTDDGIDALQSGITENSGESWIKAVTTGTGTFNFRWKTSSESSFDYLRFYVNGVQKGSRSGIGGWTDYSIALTNSGPKELMWKYTKDVSSSSGEDAGWIDQVGFEIPTVSLTVTSTLGSPVPAVGTQTYDVGTEVTCSVADVTLGTTQYVSTGWTGTGAVPSSGNTNAVTVTLDETSSITWNWQTNYWLDVTVGTGGTLSHLDGFYLAGSDQTIVATPASGYLFMYWGGDASGTNLSTMVAMSSSKSITATFSDDADNDGLTNNEEAGLGTNPRKADTDDDGFDDKLEVDNGGSPTVSDEWRVDYIRDNGGNFDLYPSNIVLDVAIGEMLLDVVGTEATLSLQLETSDDLQSWTNAGPVKVWNWTVDGDQKFFRVKSDK